VKFEPWGIACLAAEGQTLFFVSQRTTWVPFTVDATIVAPMTKIVNKNFLISNMKSLLQDKKGLAVFKI